MRPDIDTAWLRHMLDVPMLPLLVATPLRSVQALLLITRPLMRHVNVILRPLIGLPLEFSAFA
jgi:hypothetical protein